MNEIVKINPKEYGLEEPKANELTTGLDITLKERKLLIDEFETLSELEVNEENIPKFKELRLRIVKNRRQGIIKWHTTAKNYFLKGGQFVDAIKRQEIEVNELMEKKLMDAEKHFENLEKERLSKLQNDRASQLSKYAEDAHERDLSGMENDVWDAYFATKKKEYEDRIAAEKKAEEDRIAKEKEQKVEQERIRKENERLRKEAEAAEIQRQEEEKQRQKLAKIEADKLEAERKEQERIRLENEAEAKAELEKVEAEKQRLIAIEKAKADKLEAELEAKKQAEIKAENDRLADIEANAKKGDIAKVSDLINDLKVIKTKYNFKSKKNQKMYADVSILIDKLINHIEK